jgi:hypothetical protein
MEPDNTTAEIRWYKLQEVVTKMEAATVDEEDVYLVMMAGSALAGHIINCCQKTKEGKSADIKGAIKMLRLFANRDIEEVQRNFILQNMPTAGSIM